MFLFNLVSLSVCLSHNNGGRFRLYYIYCRCLFLYRVALLRKRYRGELGITNKQCFVLYLIFILFPPFIEFSVCLQHRYVFYVKESVSLLQCCIDFSLSRPW